MENFEAINKHGSVFLTNLYEPEDNKLLLEVKNSTMSDFEVDVQIGDKQLSGCKEITKDETGTFFTITFNDYVSYHVINESYANSDPKDEYISGDYGTFCIFQTSSYMDFILNETFANDIYPTELKHYGLFAANHVVHIISMHEPKIELKNH
ncbi:hypothetical protein FBD94_18175 [Pedobacter hiemivivus]|uniref:Uncharacterized protein n=1 Tax=Pedobacter hiemivivus TaxID=2530454 RepID=A0A4U1G7I6_9SPHI|nr:hypothetical protein [Pedobacter hiemivivus]TKC58543.1 hypothetical protein FBD94_18175 [Pedobacter hiemivivus]